MKISKKRLRNNSKSSKKSKSLRKSKKQSGGSFMNMGKDWEERVVPYLPNTITCPICDEKHKKDNLVYNVNSFRKSFRKKHPDGIRVRSFKLPSRRRFFEMEDLTGTVFYITCMKCNYMFIFRNQVPENSKK
jgi:hypothetical protein